MINSLKTHHFLLITALSIFGCSSEEPKTQTPPQVTGQVSSQEQADDAPSTPAIKIVFLGDSICAGSGLENPDNAFPNLLGSMLREKNHNVSIINSGVSGDSTAGGLSRTDWVLSQNPDLLVIELGANDGMRGTPLEDIEKNLRGIIEKAKAKGASVLLLGMRIPPSYGQDYSEGFFKMYKTIATSMQVDLVEDFLKGVGGEKALNQADGIHPNEEGHYQLARRLLLPLMACIDKFSEAVNDSISNKKSPG